jgi:TolB protein
MTRLVLLGLIVVALGLLAQPQTPARASFPGANGKIAFVSDRDGNQEIYVMNADGSSQTRLTNNSDPDIEPTWSPDGTRIAFSSHRDGNSDIYIMNANGTDEVRMTEDPAADASPAWSPDGTRIAFSTDRDAKGEVFPNKEVYVMNADGTDQQRLTDDVAVDGEPDWSPDGSKIAFTRLRGGSGSDIFVIDPSGGELTNLTHTPAIPGILAFSASASWSPDGESIAYVRWGVTVRKADDPEATYLLWGRKPAWSPDGLAIAYHFTYDDPIDCATPCEEIYTISSDGTVITRLTNNQFSDSQPDWQPLPAGNANCGPSVNSVDAAIILQLDAGLLDELPCPDLADVNGDGRIDALDAQLILQFDAGLIDSFPA